MPRDVAAHLHVPEFVRDRRRKLGQRPRQRFTHVMVMAAVDTVEQFVTFQGHSKLLKPFLYAHLARPTRSRSLATTQVVTKLGASLGQTALMIL